MKNFILLLFCIYGCESLAQDAHFSQYYQAPLHLNPGFTGATEHQRMVVNHRLQWPGLENAFSTYAFSYDRLMPALRSGLGISLTTEKLGSAGWRTTTGNLFYSYKVEVIKGLVFSPGLYFGYGSNGIDRSKVQFGDQLKYAGESLDPEINNLVSQHYFDIGSGFILYSKQIWLGFSAAHLNRPNISVLGAESRLPVKTTVHGGVNLPISSISLKHDAYLSPSFIYRSQGAAFSQLNLGVNFHTDPIAVGLWYSGTPFTNSITGEVAHDALILYMGLYLKKITIGYSHDFTISSLNPTVDGVHELSITYEFATSKNRKKKFSHKLIPCPSFMNNRRF